MHKPAASHEPRVAVIVFPGTNSETETVDACCDAGMDARLFWWSEDPESLRGFDGYVLAGGFAHEDRVRAGAIAAKSPIVAVIKEEAEKGKLVLGLCNGAQVLAESGMLGKVAPATVNRVCRCLCAALELARQHDDRIQNRQVWEVGLAGLPDAQTASETSTLRPRNAIGPPPSWPSRIMRRPSDRFRTDRSRQTRRNPPVPIR